MSDRNWVEERMQRALTVRRNKGMIRRLQADDAYPDKTKEDIIDFSSNDYLGLAHDSEQARLVESEFQKLVAALSPSSQAVLGATGSRLLSGDGPLFHQLETYLSRIHRRPAALLCNSGYDANLTVVSCLPCDVIVYDEYVHNSLHMGMRLWQSAVQSETTTSRQIVPFQHNNVQDMKCKLVSIQQQRQSPPTKIVVLIESVYSMDGDVAPVKDMLDEAAAFGAKVIVDEAHGLGVYGKTRRKRATDFPGTGVVAAEDVENHPALLCSIHTFGKAAGCHGAVLCLASSTHKEYLLNYGYPLIYSTALPLHSLVTIRCSYETMTGEKGERLRKSVFDLIDLFRQGLGPFLERNSNVYLLPSTSPIQALIIPGNHACTQFCVALFEASNRRIRLFPIKSPTVPAGQERVRIIIHANNTRQQILLLVRLIVKGLRGMDLLPPTPRL